MAAGPNGPGGWHSLDDKARAVPFDAIELELTRLWPDELDDEAG